MGIRLIGTVMECNRSDPPIQKVTEDKKLPRIPKNLPRTKIFENSNRETVRKTTIVKTNLKTQPKEYQKLKIIEKKIEENRKLGKNKERRKC